MKNNDMASEKCSIKNLLFTKAVPNYVIPISTSGYKVHSCTDCGDRFLFQSSYKTHINRKSIKITFGCQHCRKLLTFNNRCQLLEHIRSHAFKTATINLIDLQIEPLPMCELPKLLLPNRSETQIQNAEAAQKITSQTCIDCGKKITGKISQSVDRANHYMNYNTEQMYTCPICLFVVPTTCALETHLRIHYKTPPYFCPECGIILNSKSITYPYKHDCQGFKIMRVTSRLSCPMAECDIFHPSQYKEHMKKKHLKTVYKCPKCLVACYTPASIKKHIEFHEISSLPILYYQCELCPGRLVINTQMINHLNQHNKNIFVYPCWDCGKGFDTPAKLVNHRYSDCPKSKHDTDTAVLNKNTNVLLANNEQNNKQRNKFFRILKKCDQCNRTFTYVSLYEKISELPSNCPYSCTKQTSIVSSQPDPNVLNNDKPHIVCHLCMTTIDEDWNGITKHYMIHHKDHKCVNIKVNLKRLNMKANNVKTTKKITKVNFNWPKKTKSLKKKKTENRNVKSHTVHELNKRVVSSMPKDKNTKYCSQCNNEYENQEKFQEHVVTHRDPCSAYQCLECGMCFAVKPSFSTHLLIAHEISDVENYIKNKPCYNEDAFSKQKPSDMSNEPVAKNQCKICREQFSNEDDFEKHFRVHGMAFLMTKKLNKT